VVPQAAAMFSGALTRCWQHFDLFHRKVLILAG
jgi:hypothetical protein